MNEIAPYLSYISLTLFGITCIIAIPAVAFKMSKPLLKFLVILGISCAAVMGITSSILYVWHHYYR